jgi:hypothetical protein
MAASADTGRDDAGDTALLQPFCCSGQRSRYGEARRERDIIIIIIIGRK